MTTNTIKNMAIKKMFNPTNASKQIISINVTLQCEATFPNVPILSISNWKLKTSEIYKYYKLIFTW